ncbi:MAG: hypothetical protein DRQ52_11080 [Gammaproteobacteria bacterium]|nr:MAG: hypothetical protein DRQ52_11080 [Gammaproteobacteria bacterium]
MIQTLLPAGLLLLCGVIWRILEPGGLPVAQVRQQLNVLNIYLLIPGMIFSVILSSQIGSETWLLPIAAWLVIGTCLIFNVGVYRHLLSSTPDASKGAMILAGSFGNGVGLATPVVIALYGLDAARVPILYTLLGSLPITWTIGVAISLGHAGHRIGPMWQHLLNSPPLWAALTSLAIVSSPFELSEPLIASLDMLARAAVPLMLFTVGLSLNIKGFARLRMALPAIFSKSLLSPLVALLVGQALGLNGATLGALVVTAATASFNVGVVLADRYDLDVELYGVTVAVTATLYFCLLPIWSWLIH